MISLASPMAWPPVAQADTVVKFGPVIPNLMASWPDPMLGMPIGMRNGLIRSGPRRALVVMPSISVPIAAKTGPEDDPGPFGEVALEPLGQSGLVDRLAGRHQPELDVAIRAPDFLAIEDGARVEVADLGTDSGCDTRRVERLDRPDPGTAGEQARPRWTQRRCRGR